MSGLKSKINSCLGLIKWSLIRHKFYIPVFAAVQILLAFAIIYGFSYITNAVDAQSKTYLCTGAITMNLIAVACVLAPQIVSEAKQSGVLDYQKTLPIARVGILLSDLLVWGLISMVGVLVCIFVGTVSFDMVLRLDAVGILSLLFAVAALVLLGFFIAYIFPPNMMSLMTQLIMIGGLLFSPIIYSADRLPEWMAHIYNALPFVPVSSIVRYSLFGLEKFDIKAYIVVLVWGAAAFGGSLYILMRRK